MNFCCSVTIALVVLYSLLVSKAASQNVASPFQSSGWKREISAIQYKPTRLGKLVNLFRKTISKFRPSRKGSQKDFSKKTVRKAINELPLHETSNEIDAKIHQLIPPHQVDRKSLEEVNSYESEALSDGDSVLDKLSSYAILSHSGPSFAKVVLSNPHYKKGAVPDSSENNVQTNNNVNSGLQFQKTRVNNGIPVQNAYSASSNFVSGVVPLSNSMTSETGVHHVIRGNHINNGLQNSQTGDSPILANSLSSVPNGITSSTTIQQVRYLPSPYQMNDGRSLYQLGLSPGDYSVSPLDSNSISSNYQGTIVPVGQEGLLYKESTPILSESSYQSSLPVEGDTVYQMSTPVNQGGTIYHMPSYQLSQLTSVKPTSTPSQNQYRPYIAHPPSKTSGQFYKPVYTISKNLFGKPLKPNTFIKQNMNKLMQTIYPYYHKPKLRYPYYDKDGNGKLLYGFGTPKLYEYNVFRPLAGYQRR